MRKKGKKLIAALWAFFWGEEGSAIDKKLYLITMSKTSKVIICGIVQFCREKIRIRF